MHFEASEPRNLNLLGTEHQASAHREEDDSLSKRGLQSSTDAIVDYTDSGEEARGRDH